MSNFDEADLPDFSPFETEQPVKRVVKVESDNKLLEGSPTPFGGVPDQDYPELDLADPLYMPRFLIRRWGEEAFFNSAYYAAWKDEQGRVVKADPRSSKPQKSPRR